MKNTLKTKPVQEEAARRDNGSFQITEPDVDTERVVIKLKRGDYIGNAGTIGFVSGVHTHVEFYRSQTGKPGTWKLYDPFQNKTYAPEENIVWFTVDNIPAELKGIVKERVK